MRKELDERLCKKYPNLYKQQYMCWGFCCGDGWYDILDELSAKLEPCGVEVMQVKEKFGTLRFYVAGIDLKFFDKVQKYIREAEKKSAHTCEYCGDTETAKQRGGGWIKTLCNKCAKEIK